MPSTKPLRKRAKKDKGGRPALGGRPIYVRVHGVTMYKIDEEAERLGVGAPEVLRRLARKHL